MRVLQINVVCGKGSTGKITVDLYNVLVNQGHDCCIAYGRSSAPHGIRTIRIGKDLDVKLHGALSRITDRHGFYSINSTLKLIKQIKEIDPDIIHLHNIHGYYINIELLFKYLRDANKPIIWTLHDCWAFTGHCCHFDFINCDKWKTGCFTCPQKNEYPSSFVFDNSKWNYQKKKELFTSVDNLTIVTPSKWLMGLVKQSFLYRYPIKVINNGINLDVFKPTISNFRKRYQLESKFIILGVANVWNKKKGLYSFIELSKIIDSNFKIVLVGLTHKQIEDLPNSILGIQRTNSAKELAEIYTAADVFINPSVEETMGLVTVEALACGTPTIVSNATALPEIVDETCGLIVEKDNINELVKKITICKNIKFSRENCIRRAKSYNMILKYDEYIKLYKEVCN